MKKLNAKGFGALEAVLIVVILGIIGGAGFLVYKSQNETKTTLDNTANSQGEPEKAEKNTPSEIPENVENKDNVTANWLLYKSPDNAFQIKLVDGWELSRHVDSTNSLVSKTPLSYKPGVKAIVTVTEGGRGGPFPLYISLTDKSPNVRGKLEGEIKTDSGLVGQKYFFTQTSEESGHDIQYGDKEYSYHFSKAGKYITIVHAIFGNSKDNTEYLEKAIKTLSIN